jgi:hypothetical protein
MNCHAFYSRLKTFQAGSSNRERPGAARPHGEVDGYFRVNRTIAALSIEAE